MERVGLWADNKAVEVAGTPERLVPVGVRGKCYIQAFSSNTGRVFIGGRPNAYLFDGQVKTDGPVAAADKTEKGYALEPREAFPIEIEASDVWIDAENANDGVNFAVANPVFITPSLDAQIGSDVGGARPRGSVRRLTG